jgi:hypothetical protein
MGGTGSRRWRNHAATPLADAAPAIEVRALQRAGLLRPGVRFTLPRRRPGDHARFGVTGEVGAGEVLLQWQPAATMPRTAVAVALTETPGTFGGTRPWFLGPQPGLNGPCPGRVARLSLDGLRLGCRRCLGLTSTSQRAGEASLAGRRARRARRRFGGGPPLAPVPPRPKGMHWPTYIRLRNEVAWADMLFALALLDELLQGFDPLVRLGMMEPGAVPHLPAELRAALAPYRRARRRGA